MTTKAMWSEGAKKPGERARRDFPLLGRSGVAFLDTAASAQKPRVVLDAMRELSETSYANVHRGVYRLSQEASERFESSRDTVRGFLNARSIKEIVFTKNATEAFNLVAYSWARANLQAGDEVLVSLLEHHSNIVPWQILAEERGIVLRFSGVLPDGTFDSNDFSKKLSEKTKLVSVTMLANAIGVATPVGEIVSRAKGAGATVMLDAAQAITHQAIDVQALACDFLAFSAHKLYGPTGIGVLYGREELLEAMPPFLGGGDMIRSVTLDGPVWNDLPHKFEAGTPPIVEAIGLGAAIEYVRQIGYDAISEHERELVKKMREGLTAIAGVTVLGGSKQVSLCSFVSDKVHPHDMAQFLDNEGVAVRAGHHCAQPLLDALSCPATTRASLGVYTTAEDIERLRVGVEKAVKFFG